MRLRDTRRIPPGRWKEPGAFPATDHATQRARQGRGRHPIRRRVRGQCGPPARGGNWIPHAGAVRALVIAMIEAPFRTAPMTLAGRVDRRAAGRRATRLLVEQYAWPRSHEAQIAKDDCSVDRFSGEAARPRRRSGGTLRLDTALKPWHKRDDWLGPSKHRGGHRGPGASTSRPSPHPPQGRQPTAIP